MRFLDGTRIARAPWGARLLIAALVINGADGAVAQTLGGANGASSKQIIEVPSPILTLDWEDLYAKSAWGLRVTSEIEAESSTLAQENARIAEDLVADERSLTDRRASMQPEAFRAEADAFDNRVVGIRRAQETKARSLAARAEAERSRFVSAAIGLLDGMIEARGAVVVIDRRAIIRGAGAVDVTAEMVERVDAALGDGSRIEGVQTEGATAEPEAVDTIPDAAQEPAGTP
ncbi:OmpH family outer membrane protein [Albirhodobacter sp. R86504]|uniref:OmpH family outer membrane protein n=1 Tax=Albirhodobacter sp. R86504 TaxID=3093848 RepID=UPI003671B87E